jgi:hypothetical protein
MHDEPSTRTSSVPPVLPLPAQCAHAKLQMAQGQMEWGNRYNSISFQSTDGPMENGKTTRILEKGL